MQSRQFSQYQDRNVDDILGVCDLSKFLVILVFLSFIDVFFFLVVFLLILYICI